MSLFRGSCSGYYRRLQLSGCRLTHSSHVYQVTGELFQKQVAINPYVLRWHLKRFLREMDDERVSYVCDITSGFILIRRLSNLLYNKCNQEFHQQINSDCSYT